LVWQASCWVEQLIKQDTLALALLVVVAPLVDGVPGTTQADWQLAAVELQTIMQLVVVELCANRSGLLPPSADTPAVNATKAKMATERSVRVRTVSSLNVEGTEHSAISAAEECACRLVAPRPRLATIL
jgi:hypothetical protein